jgi:hypothetical protein
MKPFCRLLLILVFRILLISLALAADSAQAGDLPKPYQGKIIDVHSHFYRGEEDFEELLSIKGIYDIDMMGLSGLTGSQADEQALQAERVFPDHFFLFLRGFDPTWDHAPDYVKGRLSTGEYSGIGELFIHGHGRRIDGDHPVLMKIYRLAAEYRVPVLMHWTFGSMSERERGTSAVFRSLRHAVQQNPQTRFILAHCGLGPLPTRPDYVAAANQLLFDFPHLSFDISDLHDRLFTGRGDLSDFGFELQDMMRKHPNQFLTGFDIGEPGSLKQQAEQSITAIRAFLGTLPKNLARKVARENAVALLAPAIKNNQQLKADRKRTRRPAAESFPTFLYAP